MKWINRKEKLPKYGQWCIGYNINNNYSSRFIDFCFLFQAHENSPKFTHWIPLPNFPTYQDSDENNKSEGL